MSGIKSKEISNQLTIMHNFYRTNILSMLSHPSILTKRIYQFDFNLNVFWSKRVLLPSILRMKYKITFKMIKSPCFFVYVAIGWRMTQIRFRLQTLLPYSVIILCKLQGHKNRMWRLNIHDTYLGIDLMHKLFMEICTY